MLAKTKLVLANIQLGWLQPHEQAPCTRAGDLTRFDLPQVRTGVRHHSSHMGVHSTRQPVAEIARATTARGVRMT